MASMLTGDDESAPMFYKRGNKVFSKKQKGKTGKKTLEKSKGRAEKRNQIALNENGNANFIDGVKRHKSSWHSHGDADVGSHLSKKTLATGEEFKQIENYLQKLELPKNQWKFGVRSMINNAKKVLGEKLKDRSFIDRNEKVIQSLIQPSEATESKRGNSVISSLLRSIANEVEGDATPLDDYLKSIPQRKTQRNVVTRRPVRQENNDKRHFSRILDKSELKKIDDITIKDD